MRLQRIVRCLFSHYYVRGIVSIAALLAISGCKTSSETIDLLIGGASNSPLLTAVPTQIIQHTQELYVDVNNTRKSQLGDDLNMSYRCVWDTLVDNIVQLTNDCSSLPGTSVQFSSTSGILQWTPSTAILGKYEIKIIGQNFSGTGERLFIADVRIYFNGIESLTDVQGDRMTLNWTANSSSSGYQILKRNPNSTFSLYQMITDPNSNSVTITGLAPLQVYSWRVYAIDSNGINDGNPVSLSALTADLIRLEVTAADSQLSPGQSTLVTLRLKDNGGNYLTSSGLNVSFALSGTGTSSGTFSAVTDLGTGVYTSVFTATIPGTINPITAALTQFYYVDQTANMTVEPLQIEITSAANTVNPDRSVAVLARIRDYTGTPVSWGGHALSFAYSGGTSTGTFTAVIDLGNGTYSSIFTGSTAGTSVTLGATISTAATSYSTVGITVAPYTLEVSSALTDLSITRTTTATGRIKDWQGNYVTSGGQGFSFVILGALGIVTATATTDHGNGTYTSTISGLSLGTVVISASANPSYLVSQTATVTVRKLRLEILAASSNLMPGEATTLTGRVKDWQGNIVGTGGQSFDFSSSGGTSWGAISSVTDNNNGTYTATFTASTAGTASTISGSIADSYQVDTTATITVQKWLIYLSAPATIVPSGQSLTVTITVKDYLGNVASSGGQSLFISQSGGTSTGTFTAPIDNNNGTYTSTFTGATPGTAITISASMTQSNQVMQTISITVQAISLVLSTAQSSLNPGDAVYVYAQIQDASNNNLTSGTYSINFSYTGGTSTGTFSSITYLGNGLYRSTFTGANAGSAITLDATASSAYVIGTTANLTVVPWEVEIATGATAVTIGQTTTLTAKIKDHTGAYLTSGGKGVALSLATAGVGSLTSVSDNSNGTYTATFTAVSVGSTDTAANLPSSFSLTVHPTITVTTLHIALSVAQNSLNPGGGVTVSAQLKDSSGNNILTGSYVIGFSYSGGSSTGNFSSTLSLGLGLYTAVFTGNVAGTAITVSANSSTSYVIDNTVNLTVVPWDVLITSTATSFVIRETGTLTARVKDWQGNYLNTGGKSVNIALSTGGVGTISATADNSDGTYTATFTSVAAGSTGVTASLSESSAVSSSPTLTVDKAYLHVTVAGLSSSSVASGSTIVARVTITNSSGTTVNGNGYTVALSATGGTSTIVATTAITEISSGVYEMTYQGILAGTATTLSASSTVAYQLDDTADLAVTPSSVISAALSSLAVSANTVRSGLSITATATLKDAAGNLIPGLAGVSFGKTTGAGIGTGTLGAVTDAGAGQYTTTFTGVTPDASPTVLSVSSGGVTATGTVSVMVTSGAATKFTVSGPTNFDANTCSTAFRLTFFDSGNNSTAIDAPTSFTFAGLNYGSFYSDASCSASLSQLDVLTGLSQTQNFYFKTLYPTTHNLTFTSAGLTQTNTPYSVTVAPIINYIGSTGAIELNGSGNFYVSSIYDGAFAYPQGATFAMLGGTPHLFVADGNAHAIQKFNIATPSAISMVGAIGRLHWSAKGKPTGGTNAGYCTGLSGSAAINGAWCTGGQYQSGSNDGMFYTPISSTVMNISGTNFLFVSDYNNHRIMKYNADTGAFIGWTGKINGTSGTPAMTGACLAAGVGATTPGWCLGGSPAASTANTYISGANTGGTNTGGNQFRYPYAISNDGVYLYIADSGNNRLIKLDPTTGLLVHWMGRTSSVPVGGFDGTTGITCLTNTQSDGTSVLAAGQFTPSWCSGGYSISTALAQSGFTNTFLNPQFTAVRGISFYTDGTYNWMLISDSASRMVRYFCGASTSPADCSNNGAVDIGGTNYYPGQFLGWTGYVSNIAIAAATVPASISGLFNATSGASAYTTTNGWAFYGASTAVNTSAYGGLNNPYNFTLYGNYAYIVNASNQRIERMILYGASGGRFDAWIGRVSSTPIAGVSGCAGTSAGTVTPGWCYGGTATVGTSVGSFYNPADITTDGTNLYVVDRDNYRITRHDLATGASLDAIGLRVNNQQNSWTAGGYPTAPNYPANGISNNANLNRDLLISNADQAIVQGDYMYISDAGSNRIKRFDWLTGNFEGWLGLTSSIPPSGGDAACIGALVGGFTPGWCKGGGFASSSTFGFSGPRGLASDGTYLYIADQGNNRLVRVRLSDGAFSGWFGYIATTPSDGDPGCSGAAIGTVTPGWCIGGASASSASTYILGAFNAPYGLAGFTDIDTKFYLIVGDASNSRLQKIDAANPTNVWWVGRNSHGSAQCGVASGVLLPGWCNTSGITSSGSDTTSFINNGYLTTSRSIYVDTSTSPIYAYVASNAGRILRYNASTGAFAGWVGSFGGTLTNSSCESGVAATNTITPSWCYGGNASTSVISSNVVGIYSDGTYLYLSDSSGFRIMKFNRATGAYIGWKGKVGNATGLGGGTGCNTTPVGAITPAWCTGGSAVGGYEIDVSKNAAAFDYPQGLAGIGAYLFVLDSTNGRILTLPKD